jgi:hypothetical protein
MALFLMHKIGKILAKNLGRFSHFEKNKNHAS